ncbi:hypothetical protein PI124_g4544 [Phytophthora idaei]|nr:hypothetical protein PI124_g4544 [Phytophthora idaei]
MDTSEQAVPAVEELFPVQLSMENRPRTSYVIVRSTGFEEAKAESVFYAHFFQYYSMTNPL